jgi:hypothetical protein
MCRMTESQTYMHLVSHNERLDSSSAFMMRLPHTSCIAVLSCSDGVSVLCIVFLRRNVRLILFVLNGKIQIYGDL